MFKKIFALASAAVVAAVTLTALAAVNKNPLVTAVTAGDNLIANPSVEQVNGSAPASWSHDKWGTNTTTFTHATTGHTGSRSLSVKTTGYKTGDAKWYFTPVTVTASTSYVYSDWYKSTVATDVDVVVTSTAGKVSYLWQGTLPASSAWKQASFQFKTPTSAKNVTVYHYIHGNGQLDTDDYSLTQVVVPGTPAPVPTPPAPSAPTVQLTAPAPSANIVGTVNVTANASDAQGIASVQFKLDGQNLGSADTTAPYSTSWNSTTVANGTHTLSAVATNQSNLTATSSVVSVTVNNPTPPVVAVTVPANGATVSGTQTVTATATSNVAISSVQFKVDGNDVGLPDTTAPYSIDWVTTGLANGQHNITATAVNSANQITTSAQVTVNVNNVVVVPPPVTPPSTPANMLSNPSMELNVSNAPTNWQNSNWNSTATFTYQNTGHTGSHSLTTNVTNVSSGGGADWYFTPVAVQGNQSYQYSDWYQSTANTEIDVEITLADNTTQYLYVTTAPASANWQQVTGTFTTPANAVSATVYQVISTVGSVTIDDASLTPYTPAQFTRGLVSMTFDDGWRDQYNSGRPLLNAAGLPVTYYLLTSTVSDPEYMTTAMMQDLKNDGNELAAHTVTHPHLPTLTVAQIDSELADSQTQLRTWFGATGVANNFATPYGEYNATVITEIKKYYRSHRSTDVGFNSKDAFDIYNIKVQNIEDATTPAQVQAWVDQAITNKTWLVLVYHRVGVDTPGTEDYGVSVANLNTEINYIKSTGVAVKTVDQALDEIVPQL